MVKKKVKKEKSVCSVIFDTYRIFLQNITSRWFLMVGLSLIPALVSPFKIYLEKNIFDTAAHAFHTDMLQDSIVSVFTLALLTQIAYIISYSIYRCSINYIGSELEVILQNRLNQKTARLDLIDFEDSSLYKNIELACNVSRDLRFMIMMFTSEVLVYCVTFLSVSGILLSYHYSLILMGGLAVFPDIFTKAIQAKYQYKSLNKLQEYARSKTYFENLLTSPADQKEIRVYGTKDFFIGKWDTRKKDYHNEKQKVSSRNLITNILCGLISCITAMGAVVLAVWLLFSEAISLGEFASALSAVLLLKANFLRILNLGLFSMQCGLKGKYYYSVMDYRERKGERKKASPSDGIILDQVSFSYMPDRNVLNKISVSLNPKQTIAVVGKNGAGKSTFSKLLLGLYRPTDGNIYYGKENIESISEECLYQSSSAIFQDFCKYYFSICENVMISASEEKKDIGKAIQLLSELDFKIKGKPLQAEQMDTGLGVEFGGIELSGGNWQKLAIARGLYRTHDFIVFDEPTSALDPLIEEKIFKEMLEKYPNTSKVFITHRMSTTATADWIIVIDDGKIAELGTHEELMKKKGIYAELWKTQAGWYK